MSFPYLYLIYTTPGVSFPMVKVGVFLLFTKGFRSYYTKWCFSMVNVFFRYDE
ncbi:MAG: hypothetical protein N4A74_16400 [Carboxylicivirga sp.]|nr:hypothetical protein [Carboxylicivirga sp.]